MTAGDVAPADGQPLPPHPRVDPEVLAAGERILGADAADPATVKLWWYGVSGFIVSACGHLFLFDAWESLGVQKDYVPIGREELVVIAPEAILIGHGHFDHAGDLGYIAGHARATEIGRASCRERVCPSV